MYVIDFETYSRVDITTKGLKHYATHPSTTILCMAVSDNGAPAELVLPGQGYTFDPARKIYAHNAMFEYEVWATCGVDFGIGDVPPLSTFVDVMALAARYGYPMNLDGLGTAMDLPIKKDRRGKELIKICCTPNGKEPLAKDYEDLFDYCIRDVDVTVSAINNFPTSSLTESEQRVWKITQDQNLLGIPIDTYMVTEVQRCIETYKAEGIKALPELTGGEVTTPNQIQRIIKFAKENGVTLNNLQVQTVAEKLQDPEVPDVVRKVLEVRQSMGKSSASKFKTLHEQTFAGRYYHGAVFYGAGTGRWAGRGFQHHNLPRVSAKDPEATFERIVSERSAKLLHDASSLLRSTIHASVGKTLVVADYSSIENRIVAWLAGDEATLQLFRDGKDQYKDMATAMFNVNYEDVTKQQRQDAKPAVLGCGFGMGKVRFQAHAKTFGMNLTLAEAERHVNTYRRKYSKVVNLWYRLHDIARAAVTHEGSEFQFNGCKFKVIKGRDGHRWLRYVIPSGRSLRYRNPRLVQGKYGLEILHDNFTANGALTVASLPPGRITENAVQALARDILVQGLFNIQENMPELDVFMTVHDEVVCEIDNEYLHTVNQDEVLTDLYKELCRKPEWAKGLPLEAEGYIGTRFRKG